MRELQPEDEENDNEEDFDEEPLMRGSNEFTLANSFWFTVGTLMQQGSDLNPQVTTSQKGLSAKTV